MTTDFSSMEIFDDDNEDNKAKLLLHWHQFELQLPDERASRKELYEISAQEKLLCCHSCGKSNLEKNYNTRVLRCLSCGKQTWYTAGTFFDHVKLIRPWLAAIWLMEHGVIFNASQLCKLVGIAPSSALYIIKKLTFVITNDMQEKTDEIPSSVFIKAICKRSRQTPRNAHPAAEEELIDQKDCQYCWHQEPLPAHTTAQEITQESIHHRIITQETGESELSSYQPANIDKKETRENHPAGVLNEQEQIIYDLLLEKTMSCSELHARTGFLISELSATLVIMELKGVIERLPGDRYALSKADKSETAINGVDSHDTTNALPVINFIRENFHGISRKYLQNYLAFHWYIKNNIHCVYGSLLKACLHFRHIRYDEILSYVTPQLVRVITLT